MAWHAQLKFVMTECSKTQIRLTGLKLLYFVNHKKKTKCFVGDFIANHFFFKFCVQNYGLLKI